MATATTPRARIGRISGPFLAPGVSRNKRLYTKEAIATAVQTMRGRLADPNGKPITMLTHHAAGDKSTEIAARVTGVDYDPVSGHATYEADIADTAAGHDILALATPGDDGKRYLDGVSIRGWWNGPVESKIIDGAQIETADDLEVDGIDFTKSPGVDQARIDKVLYESAVVEADGRQKVIVEHVDPAVVTDQAAEEAAGAVTAGSNYADPGYQKDGKKRYPLNSAARVRSAWSYINAPKNAGKYTAAQLKRIKGKIRAAAKKFGVDISTDEAWSPDAILEAHIAEAYASMSVDNGPGTVSVSAYGVDPPDIQAAASRIAKAALAGMAALDPDCDGDIDLDDDDEFETQECPSCGDMADVDANYCPSCGTQLETSPSVPTGNAGTTETKEATVPEETTPQGGTAATTETTPPAGAEETFTKAQVDELVAKAREEKAAAETAGAGTPPAGTQETADKPLTREDFLAMVDEAATKKTDELRESLLKDYGPPKRKGLARLEEKAPSKPLHEMSSEELRQYSTEVIAAAFPSTR